MYLSIIVPTYNEEKNIEKIIHQLKNLKGGFEVIFVDGGSSDSTCRLISSEIVDIKNFKLIHSSKGRAVQMNAAVEVSKGEVLWFLHCDSEISPNSVLDISEAIKNSPVGCFSIYFKSKKHIMKICGFMSRFRVSVRNIAFGDQGIFIEKSLFEDVGGYKEIPIMEDYQLSMDIKSRGIKINQISTKIFTDDRRYAQGGYLMTMYRMQKNQQKYRIGRAKALKNIEYDDRR